MDLDKTIDKLQKSLLLFGLNHRCTKLELYRQYQKYLKKWKLNNFESMEEKLSASKKIDDAHKAYDFIKTNWNYLIFLKRKEENYDRSILVIVFIFMFVSMITYMQTKANRQVRLARQQAVEKHELNWAWTHGMSDSLVKKSKLNALDDFWGKIITDSIEVEDYLTFWPLTLNRHNQSKIREDILNGSPKHTVFPNEEYQKNSTIYKTARSLTVPDNKTPLIVMDEIIFFRNHYEMIFKIEFDNKYNNQKILDIDFGTIYKIEPKYYPKENNSDSVWTKQPYFPILLDNFMENCVKSGGGLLYSTNKINENIKCVFRFTAILSYKTDEITFLGVGSALNDIPVNIKPYVNKLKKEWNEKLPYRPLEWKKWKPFVLK